MTDPLAQELADIRHVLAHPGWAAIKQRLRAELAAMKGLGHAERDPVVSVKHWGAVYGWERCLDAIATCVQQEAAEEELPPDDFASEPFGEDKQEKET